MSDVSDDKLREILAGCERMSPGPSPGPWLVEGRYVMAEGRCVAKFDWAVRDARDDENAAHISRLDPQTVEAIVTELLTLRSNSSTQSN
jgi:hypothetical protein